MTTATEKEYLTEQLRYFDRLGQFHQDNHAVIYALLDALCNANILADFRQSAYTIKVLPYIGGNE